MSPQKPRMTPRARVTRAAEELAAGDHTAATAYALVAIAELLLPQEVEVTPISPLCRRGCGRSRSPLRLDGSCGTDECRELNS